MAVGRFAPSPSGPLHLGNLRTALLAWLVARSAGSTFLLRVEDLDPASSREEHVAGHQHDLQALGLDWDGPVVRQSDRAEAHHAAIARLDEQGSLYPCFCSRREVLEAAQAPHEHLPEGAYAGTCRDLSSAQRAERVAGGRTAAVRLRAGGAQVSFTDRLAGPTEGVVDDFVVRRRDGGAAYNLAVVVDDDAQGVQEVVRGDDLLAGTPRQIYLAGLLGADQVAYAHVPLALGPGGERLAKRDGAVTLENRLALGERPAQLLGLLASSLGIAGAGPEPDVADLIELFDLAQVPRHPWAAPVS